VIYKEQGRYELAEPLYKQVLALRSVKLGPDHRDNLRTRHHLAVVYLDQKKIDLATGLLEGVVAARTAKLGPNHVDTLNGRRDLGLVYAAAKDFSRAETVFKQLLEAHTATKEPDHIESILARDHLADLYDLMKEYERSIPLLEQSLAQRELQLGPDNPEVLARRVTLGASYCNTGHFEQGLALIERVRDQRVPDPHPAWVRTLLLRAYLQAGRPAEATVLIKERTNEARWGLPADSLELLAALVDNGKLLVEAKEFDAAQTLLLEAQHGLRQSKEATKLTEQLQDARSALVQLYDAWGKPEDAARWRRESDPDATAAEE
jgi:eukaryotic-like serine/threonine-protein kinase